MVASFFKKLTFFSFKLTKVKWHNNCNAVRTYSNIYIFAANEKFQADINKNVKHKLKS